MPTKPIDDFGADAPATPAALSVRMLTDHGPRGVRPRVCAAEDSILARKDGLARAFGTVWRWSPIQRCWVEV